MRDQTAGKAVKALDKQRIITGEMLDGNGNSIERGFDIGSGEVEICHVITSFRLDYNTKAR